MLAEGGAQQIAGYFLSGDVLGVDGIGGGRHCASACALEDSEVRRLPYVGMEAQACEDSRPRPFLLRLHSREVVRGEGMMLALGSMNAQERLAGFLPDLPRRYRLRGYSSTEFVLRFKRCEIGSYLGIKLETVSRLLAQFQHQGLLEVAGRSIRLLDLGALRGIIGQSRSVTPASAQQFREHRATRVWSTQQSGLAIARPGHFPRGRVMIIPDKLRGPAISDSGCPRRMTSRTPQGNPGWQEPHDLCIQPPPHKPAARHV